MRTGGFALVSGGPAGEVLPVRLAALPNPYYADDAVSGDSFCTPTTGAL
jgi:hypothetical protein